MQRGGIFLRSFRDLIRWSILKNVLITGIPLMIIWIFIGYVVWDRLLEITTLIIGWVPFSIVRVDGALLILFFIWSMAVLVSFAFVTAILGPILFKKINSGYYYYSFGTLIFFAIFWMWVIISNWSIFQSAIANKLLLWLPFQTVAEGSAWLLNFYILYSLYILSLYLVLAVYRKDFLLTIKEIDYPDVEISDEDIEAKHSFVALRDAILYIILTILCFPLLFVPFVNVLTQMFLWAWLYRDANFIGTCKLICTNKEYQKYKTHKFTIWSIAIFSSILNFLPVLNIFAPFFAQLMAFHWIMQEKLNNKH